MKISKPKMFFKFMRMILYRVRKGMFYLPAVSQITVDDLFHRINSNNPPLLIDVWSAQGFNEGYGHIPNSRSIPIMELGSNLEDLRSFREKEIVTICPGGGMSLVAAEILAEAGFKDVKSLTGGKDLWWLTGYPTTTS